MVRPHRLRSPEPSAPRPLRAGSDAHALARDSARACTFGRRGGARGVAAGVNHALTSHSPTAPRASSVTSGDAGGPAGTPRAPARRVQQERVPGLAPERGEGFGGQFEGAEVVAEAG